VSPFSSKICAIAAMLPVLLGLTLSTPASSQDATGYKPASLTVLNYVTGWIHDAVGYHPAVFMMIENTSGQDLSNTPIRIQARFTDLQTAEVTIGRRDVRRDLKYHQQISLSLAGTSAYELPFEVQEWPNIEAKLMCRIGNVGDEGTETLMISKIEPITHTEEEAFESLNQKTSYAPRRRQTGGSSVAPARPPVRPRHREADPPPEKPLVATAQRVDQHGISTPRFPAATAAASSPAMAFLSAKTGPGLGDDFYAFEQALGLPQEFDAKHGDWTWARYRHGASGVEVIGGAREHRGNVDVLIVKVPKSSGLDEAALSNLARNFSGKMRAQALSPVNKSVRYLPSGRLPVVTRNASGYRVLCMGPTDESDNCFILILARAPHDAEHLLAAQAKKVSLLNCVRALDQQ
jgi:hypothetical protein